MKKSQLPGLLSATILIFLSAATSAALVDIGDGLIYDAVADSSWIQKGSRVKVIKQEATQIYVKEIE